MTEGDAIPDVTVTLPDGARLRLRDLALPAVVYFYPKDMTPGCTREAEDFSALAKEFAAAGVGLLGISKDSPRRHANFIAKHDLAIRLASDEDGSACAAFGVWIEKQLYGRSYMGIERATFLFGGDGKLARKWHGVKVAGHAAAVLDAARG